MFFRLILMIISLWFSDNLQAAVGPQCFNYEVHAHRNLIPIPNQATRNYGEIEREARHAATPVLAAPPHAVGISLMRHGIPPVLWQHNILVLAGGPLNWQEACQTAISREPLGIQVQFQHQPAILAVSLGVPPAMAAPLAGMAPAAFIQYLTNALRGGGYLSPQAAALYRIRNNFPQPVFTAMAGVALPPDCVVIHFRHNVRVSKNLKELSYNACLAPGGGGYLSIKDIIDNQFAVAVLPAPSSATIVSADFLQPD